jgi:hypothetical protein
VAPDDFAVFASAAALAAVTVLLGSIVPALRAIGVDPSTAMYRDA